MTQTGTRIAVHVAFTSTVAGPDGNDGSEDEDSPTPVAALLDGARPDAATLTLLGLLHWLWEEAALTVAPPPDDGGPLAPPARLAAPAATAPTRVTAPPRRDRRWDDCSAALSPVVAGLRLGADAASERLHVIAPFHRPPTGSPVDGAERARAAARDARVAAFLRPLEHSQSAVIHGGPRRGRTRHLRHRRLLLGELKDLTATPHGHKLALRHFPRPLFLSAEQHSHLTRTYPTAFSERRGATARRVLLVLVEGTPAGYLRVVDAAAMLTSSGYIPGDSSHELIMIDALVAAGRAFFKPLRYGGTDVHPDFVLTDTSPATVVEVWGMTHRADYDTRKAAKQAHYRSSGANLILEWDVREPLPTIPPPPSVPPLADDR